MLSERDRDILDFEVLHGARMTGQKEHAIRTVFSLSGARYAQLLNRVMDDPDAMRVMPSEVKRLQRLRAQRLKNRAEHHF